MYPRIELGPVTLYSYGLMLAIGFGVAIGLTCAELRRRRLDPAHALWVALIAIPAAVVGSRLLFMLEEPHRVVSDPVGTALSGGGLSFYGGLALALAAVYPYLRWTRIPFLTFADAAAPGMLLGRGIARIGCHLAGDGDYGLPTTLPWGTDYSRGVYPPSHAFAQLPELAQSFPGGVVPDDLPLHPTGVYEFVISALLFAVIWRYRSRFSRAGSVFMAYLLATGGIRVVLELVAAQPPLALGLTEAQLISLGLIATGAVGWGLLAARPASPKPLTPTR